MGFARGLRRMRLLGERREAFWHIGPERLVVGVMEARVDEPLLVACADLFTRAGTAVGTRVAPGVLDLARAVAACDLDHVAALDPCYYEVRNGSAAGDDRASDQVEVRVRGLDDSFTVHVDGGIVDCVIALFACADLRLVSLDCAHSAHFNLVSFAEGQAPAGDAFAEAVAADPLAAVSVAAGCEISASSLGEALRVPVGLALGRYGFADGG